MSKSTLKVWWRCANEEYGEHWVSCGTRSFAAEVTTLLNNGYANHKREIAFMGASQDGFGGYAVQHVVAQSFSQPNPRRPRKPKRNRHMGIPEQSPPHQ